jgi:SAM-dependent methyltransferase
MFWPDVIALKEFYSSPLGQMANHAIGRSIQRFWPDVKGEAVLGLGFTTPYLTSFLPEAQGVFACMPSQQGVIHWPPQARNLSLLSDEAELPFGDNTIQRALVVHALENSEHARQMMAELWRVLSPAGRLLMVVPNRLGIWSRAPHSPFAYGQPFTSSQFRQLLSEHPFTPLRFVLRWAPFIEGVGCRFFSGFGGVLLLEAEKRIYAPTAQKAPQRARRAYAPSAQPAAWGT